ncbi:MAG: hypothetical protein ABJ364_03490 [Lentilitoribacter sp.]
MGSLLKCDARDGGDTLIKFIEKPILLVCRGSKKDGTLRALHMLHVHSGLLLEQKTPDQGLSISIRTSKVYVTPVTPVTV